MKYKLKDHAGEPLKRLALSPPRFLVYIDGYNLYKGINHEDPPDLLRLGWSNYQKLGERLVDLAFDHLCSQRTVKVKYFTAKVNETTGTAGEIERQSLWLERLHEEAPCVEIIEGMHVSHSKQLGDRKEKMTDVNIAVHGVTDVLAMRPAGIVLVSGDRDFLPVVQFAARAEIPVAMFFPQEHELVRLPPGAPYSSRVRITHLTRDVMSQCRLTDEKWLRYLESKVRDHPKV